jgi:hypothetical protein
MKLFRKWRTPPIPQIVEEVQADPAYAIQDLAAAAALRQDAEGLDGAARDAVERLARSRIRNGFAPTLESLIIKRHLGGAV